LQDKEDDAGILTYFKSDDAVLRKLDGKDLKILIREQYYIQLFVFMRISLCKQIFIYI